MTSIRQRAEPDLADRRRLVARALRPFVEGTAPGMSSWLLTEARVAATARDAAEAVLPLLGVPARSPHRVRGLIVPAIVCGWAELDEVFEQVLDKLLALPPALPDVAEPSWDDQLPEPRATRSEPASDVPAWTPDSRDGDIVVGPAGTTGTLVRVDRRHALIVEDGRPVRSHSRCDCDPARRRGRAEVAYERITFGRGRRILDVRAGHACPLCRAPVGE
ncbi:MAG TPA: hypothetical protein VKA54_22860 [Gemmatimonadaceae bacterium]|nr:hypothetical protein [Gemmatimonadaceae bacterium]